MRRAFSLLALALASACVGGPGGFARGAYAPEYEPLRSDLGDALGRILVAAKEDVPLVRELVREGNAKEPGAGTGALVQRVLLLVALEVATGGALDVKPASPREAPP